jgi:hypothetical protein
VRTDLTPPIKPNLAKNDRKSMRRFVAVLAVATVPALVYLMQGRTPAAVAQNTKAAQGGPVTAAQVFENMMKATREKRAREPWNPQTHRLNPYLILDMQPEDWLGTEEGRFAHSIKIPNPVPADSGYRSGMTQQEYFQHLCKNEAGEFIFKTADNVESIAQLRVRPFYKGSDAAHLHHIEDPYGYFESEVEDPAFQFVNPKFHLYKQFEIPVAGRRNYDAAMRQTVDPSLYAEMQAGAKYARFFGREDGMFRSMRMAYETSVTSRYAFTWRGLKRPNDRELGIGGGELIVLDLKSREVMGVRRGYAIWNGRWTGRMCPRYGYIGGQDKSTHFSAWFTAKVARPAEWREYFARMEVNRVTVGDPSEKRY